MLISSELKILYAAVGCTGDTAITEVLRPWLTPSVPEDQILAPGLPGWERQWHALGSPYSFYDEHRKQYENKIEEGYAIFTTVRDPWERAAYVWSKPKWIHLDPEDFLTRVSATGIASQLLRPAYSICGPDPWCVLPFETLPDSWAAFCTSMDMPVLELAGLDNLKVSTDAMEQMFSAPACNDWVLNHFASDISMFGYTPPDVDRTLFTILDDEDEADS